MRKREFLWIFLLIILIVGVLSVSVAPETEMALPDSEEPPVSPRAAAPAEDVGYTMTEPYLYGVNTYAIQWRTLGISERRATFEIPEDMVENMTTDALARTVLANSFIMDIVTFDTLQMGVKTVSDRLSGLKELLNRPDVYDVLRTLHTEYIGWTVPYRDQNYNEGQRLRAVYSMEALLRYLEEAGANVPPTGPDSEPLEHDISYTITAPYIYEKEIHERNWKCPEDFDIPEGMMENLTTEALARTVLANPLVFNMTAFDTIKRGVESVSGTVPGLKELLNRPDFYDVLKALYAEYMSWDYPYEDENYDVHQWTRALFCMEDLLQYLEDERIAPGFDVLAVHADGVTPAGNDSYTITEPYIYGVDIHNPEWENLTAWMRRATFDIPEDMIPNMTTDALARTVLSNPFVSDIAGFRTVQEGVESVSSRVPGLKALLNRTDFYDVLKALYTEYTGPDVVYEGNIFDGEQLSIAVLNTKELLQYWEEKSAAPDSDMQLVSPDTAALAEDGGYTITGPYIYGIDVHKAEWRRLETWARRATFSIPEDMIPNMTTDALTRTVLSDVFLGDMFAFGNIQKGVEAVSSDTPGLKELLNRPDFYDVLKDIYAEYTGPDVVYDGNIFNEEELSSAILHAEGLLEYLEGEIEPYFLGSEVS